MVLHERNKKPKNVAKNVISRGCIRSESCRTITHIEVKIPEDKAAHKTAAKACDNLVGLGILILLV